MSSIRDESCGVLVPLVTPFTDDLSSISESRLARLIRRCRGQGARGYVVASEVGEFFTLGRGERKHLLEMVMREVGPGETVIANVTAIGTFEAIDLAVHAAQSGARAVCLGPPFGIHLTAREIADHLRAVIDYSEAEVVLVGLPDGPRSPAGSLIGDHPRVLWAKSLLEVDRGPFALGRTPRCDAFALEGAWCTPWANLSPAALREKEAAAWEGARLAERLASAHPAKVIKGALEMLDVEVGHVRGPLQTLADPERRALAEVLPLFARDDGT